MTSATSFASNAMPGSVAGVVIPDSKLAREVTELVRDTEPPLLFHHSSRVYYWARSPASAAPSALIPSCFTPVRCSTTWAGIETRQRSRCPPLGAPKARRL